MRLRAEAAALSEDKEGGRLASGFIGSDQVERGGREGLRVKASAHYALRYLFLPCYAALASRHGDCRQSRHRLRRSHPLHGDGVSHRAVAPMLDAESRAFSRGWPLQSAVAEQRRRMPPMRLRR